MSGRGFQHSGHGGRRGAILSTQHLVIFGLSFICFLPFLSDVFASLIIPPPSSSYYCPPQIHVRLSIHTGPKWKYCLRITFNYCVSFIRPYIRSYWHLPSALYIPGDLYLFKLCISLSKEALHATSEDCSLKHILLWPPENSFPCCYLRWL